MRNPFKHETIQLGELHDISSKHSNEYITITELYDLAIKYKNALDTERQNTADVDKEIKRLHHDIVRLTNKNRLLQDNLNNLGKVRPIVLCK